MTTTTAAGTFAGKTAAEWRAEANRAEAERHASWERSDTDGFLSQWASGVMAGRYEHCATVAEDGGFTTTALFDLDGNHIPARYVETRYGWSWVWDGPNGEAVWFRESAAQKDETRRRNDAKKGVYVGTALFGAWLEKSSGIPHPDRREFIRAIDNGQDS